MVRVTADEAGRIRIGRALPGRGAYLHDDPRCVGAAVKRGAIARSLKRRVVGVEEQELVRRVHEARGPEGSDR
jgi:predicted RNA-binding protein YlxR (DUF448 family)